MTNSAAGHTVILFNTLFKLRS